MMIKAAPISAAASPMSSYTLPTRTKASTCTVALHCEARLASISSLVRASSVRVALSTMCRRVTPASTRSASFMAWFMAQSATLVKSVGTRMVLRMLIGAVSVGAPR